jgi:hypothetical protein
MKSKLFELILLVLLSISARPVFAEHKRPLTEHDLVALLAGGVYSSRVAALVEDRGIAFVPTQASLELLRSAGAQESLEHAVAVAPQIIPTEMPSHTKISSNPLPGLRTLSDKKPSVMPEDTARQRGQSSSHSQAQTSIRLPLPSNRIASPSMTLPSGGTNASLSASLGANIPVGTRITMNNWFKYQQAMPLGMIELFKGNYFWKMPQDIEIDVGPTTISSPTARYAEATKKYSESVHVVHLANGHNDIENYKGGMPFPNPQEPDKGYKLLADLWFAYVPHMLAGTARNPLSTCSETRNGYVSCTQFSYIFRQLAYNTDMGVPIEEANGRADWYTEWLSVEQPEQLKYTTLLTLYPRDNQQPKEVYIFVPALRRWIRGSLASHCSSVAGTDYAQDDYKREGFNGGIGVFGAKFIGRQQILALIGDYAALGGDFPNNYYMPLGWPKPSWGQWQLRDVDVIDVRHLPTEKMGYCYGKRILYEDASTHYALWEDVYDTKMRLWKTALLAQRTVAMDSVGTVPGGFDSSAWDLKNDHMTNTSTQSRDGVDVSVDYGVPKEYQDIATYSTPAGLAEIMK